MHLAWAFMRQACGYANGKRLFAVLPGSLLQEAIKKARQRRAFSPD
jgi:hypothetical protein